MKAILIGGIPGSGKTTLAKKLLQAEDILIDDPRYFSKDVLPYLGQNLIITDPHFCFRKIREVVNERLVKVNYAVYEILLLTPLELCWERVQKRNDERNITFKELKRFYAGLNS